jgi:hypothetical protein
VRSDRERLLDMVEAIERVDRNRGLVFPALRGHWTL